jgi:hypothetical protein
LQSEEQENQHQPIGVRNHEEEGHSHRRDGNNDDNSRIERNENLTTTQPSEVDKALTELKRKMDAMEKKEKHKAAVVSKLFAGTKTSFTKRVVEYPLPNKFKSPQISSYNGVGDLMEHLENYRMHLALHATPDEVACRAFPTTLLGNAREWFRSLTPGSIDTFEDLARAFLTHFLGS